MSSSGSRILVSYICGCGGLTRRLISSSSTSPILDKRVISSSNHFRTSTRLKSSLAETTSSKEKPATNSGFEDLDKPIKFTTSKAAEWKATDTHGGGADHDTPSIQPLAVTLSVAIFLLYFLVLREENDVDEEMKIPLWERIPGLEKQQLEMLLKYNEEHNLPTTDISERLTHLKKQQGGTENKTK